MAGIPDAGLKKHPIVGVDGTKENVYVSRAGVDIVDANGHAHTLRVVYPHKRKPGTIVNMPWLAQDGRLDKNASIAIFSGVTTADLTSVADEPVREAQQVDAVLEKIFKDATAIERNNKLYRHNKIRRALGTFVTMSALTGVGVAVVPGIVHSISTPDPAYSTLKPEGIIVPMGQAPMEMPQDNRYKNVRLNHVELEDHKSTKAKNENRDALLRDAGTRILHLSVPDNIGQCRDMPLTLSVPDELMAAIDANNAKDSATIKANAEKDKITICRTGGDNSNGKDDMVIRAVEIHKTDNSNSPAVPPKLN